MELAPILKFANTFESYRGISVWSPPEALRNKKKQDLTPDMDAYSFGMLMWEIWHETQPFDNDLNLCSKYVLEEDSRPMIQAGDPKSENLCDEEMAKLIRLCW